MYLKFLFTFCVLLLNNCVFFVQCQYDVPVTVDLHSVDNICSELDRHTQDGIYIPLLTGKWFVAEYINHPAGYIVSTVNKPRAKCISFNISLETTMVRKHQDTNTNYHISSTELPPPYGRNSFEFIKLVWNADERDKQLFTLIFESQRLGLWKPVIVPNENGFLWKLQEDIKTGPNTTIRVIKAVNDHMVLSFCQEDQAFSLVLTRRIDSLTNVEIDSVHKLFNRIHMPINDKDAHRLCLDNSSVLIKESSVLIMSAMMMIMTMPLFLFNLI